VSGPRGSIYDLVLKCEIRAEGMHDALRIERHLEGAIADALDKNMKVLSISSGPHVDMKASPKNFAPASQDPS